MMMAVMLSAPRPSVVCKLGGQLMSIIISTTVARPWNLLLFIAFSSFVSILFFEPLRGGDLPAAPMERPLAPVLLGLFVGWYEFSFSLPMLTKSTAYWEVMQSQMPSQAVITKSS